MKIVFFYKETGEVITNSDGWLFVYNNEVYADNYRTCESQAAVVSFEDFISKRDDIDWRVEQ